MSQNLTPFFSLRRASAGLLAFAAIVVPPVLAQGDGGGDAPATPSNPSGSLEPIAADGFQAFMDLMTQFAKDQIDKLPSGDKSPRENAYGKLAMIQLAGAGSALALPAAGVALGGGIGLCVDACTGGVDAGTGTLVGGSIGLGSGVVVGVGAFVTSLLATVPMVDEIEARYPPETGADDGSAAALRVGRGKALSGANAGLYESFYVNMVAALPDQFVTVIEQWDRAPGLGASEKNWLRSIAFARPQLQRLAWTKRHLRVAPNAAPASDLFLDVGRVLSGDQAAIERTWLAALGLGATGIDLKDDKLSLSVPPALRAVGLPARLQANVPHLKVKVGGNGGALDPYLRLELAAGPFDVDLGHVEVVKTGSDRDSIAVSFKVNKGARLGAARLSVKAGGDETKVLDLRPALDRALTCTLFFRLQGLALTFHKVRLGDVECKFDLPKEVRDLPVVKDLLRALNDAFEHDLKDFLRENVPFARLFDGFGEGAVQSLGRTVQRDAGRHGLAGITQVTKAEVKAGVLQLHVRGRELSRPKLPGNLADAENAWGAVTARSGRVAPIGRGTSIGARPATPSRPRR